ncbi:MAG: 50S ribosomal protein L5 [Patescibacteria group bacterium]
MRLKEKYKKEILPELKKKFGYKNDFMAPKLEKVVVNVGFGRNYKDNDLVENIKKSLTNITGQRCVLTKSKKSISAFKIRDGLIIGAMVTLRGERMYDFIEKLVNVTFPRVRDFRGISEKSVDKNGNLTVGFREHLPFPEISPESIENVHGLEVSISTGAKSREEGLEFLKQIGFPFKKEIKN